MPGPCRYDTAHVRMSPSRFLRRVRAVCRPFFTYSSHRSFFTRVNSPPSPVFYNSPSEWTQVSQIKTEFFLHFLPAFSPPTTLNSSRLRSPPHHYRHPVSSPYALTVPTLTTFPSSGPHHTYHRCWTPSPARSQVPDGLPLLVPATHLRMREPSQSTVLVAPAKPVTSITSFSPAPGYNLPHLLCSRALPVWFNLIDARSSRWPKFFAFIFFLWAPAARVDMDSPLFGPVGILVPPPFPASPHLFLTR